MAEHCVLKSTADKMKRDIKDGTLDIKALFNIPESSKRRTILEKYASPELAKFINGKLEEAIATQQSSDLKKWMNETLNPQQKLGKPYQEVMGKIDELKDLGVLNNANADKFSEDLIVNKMGVSLKTAEMKGITDRANALQTAFEKPEPLQTNMDYWAAKNDMDKYMKSINPSHTFSVITDPLRRANILFHISGMIKKTISEISEGSMRASAQRLTQLFTGEPGTFISGDNNKFARDQLLKNMEIVIHTRYNPMLTQNLEEGSSFLGEDQPHAEGKGGFRAYVRAMGSMIQHMYNTPAQFFASVAWTDTANILSTQFAEGNQVKALEFFKDATNIIPKTPEGQEIRMRAIEEGLKASFQNKGAISTAILTMRNALDKATGDINLGKQLMPIAKVPANAGARGLDYAGAGLIRAFHTEDTGMFNGWNRLPEAIKELKAGNKIPMQGIVKQFVQSGLGLGLAAVIVHNLNPDDYIPAYSGSSNTDKNLKQANNGIYNSLKLGSRYVALSFLGPLAIPVMAGLVMKKEGALGYGKGIMEAMVDMPGVSSIQDIFKSAENIGSKNGYQKVAQGMMNTVSDYITSIFIPSEVKEVAAGTDSVQRNTEGNPIAKAENKLPFSRETLPPKINEMTGEPVKEEGIVSRALMGANLTTPSSDPVIKEIDRLSHVGQSPTIGNIEYSSPRIKSLLKQNEGSEAFNDLGNDKLTGVVSYYGKYYHSQATQEIETDEYKEGNDEDKKDILTSIHKDALEETLDHFGYVKPEKRK